MPLVKYDINREIFILTMWWSILIEHEIAITMWHEIVLIQTSQASNYYANREIFLIIMCLSRVIVHEITCKIQRKWCKLSYPIIQVWKGSGNYHTYQGLPKLKYFFTCAMKLHTAKLAYVPSLKGIGNSWFLSCAYLSWSIHK